MSHRPTLKNEARRAARIRKVVAGVMSRRAAGAAETDQEVLARHVDLMPELASELRLLAMLERAAGSSGGSSGVGWEQVNGGRFTGLIDEGAFEGYSGVREIYRGGQGVVFEAVQVSTGRRVAIKVMREGLFGSDREAARFEREVRILARLEHPGIVGILDSGVRQGHVYSVMEFVAGVALDAAAAGKPLRERLRLFAEVCEAVNAAHVRGIIHRDLKPANIMVDEEGRPRVLDFGLARLTGDGAPSQHVTMAGQFVGSMPWASPEQVSGDLSAVDLRTDVYSLGVMLYQITTGGFPYSVEGSPREVLERIQNAEPRRPRSIDRQIPEDVEAITLKCLRKDPDQRYPVAGEIAMDLRRFLEGRAVVAQPPDLGYQLRSFARRKRGLIVAGAAVLLVLSVGVAGTVLALVRALRAERLAGERLKQVERESKATDAVNDFLLDLLALAHPSMAKGRDVTLLKGMLDKAGPQIDWRFPERHDIQARLHNRISATYRGLGIYGDAEGHARLALESARRAYGGNHVEVATALRNLGLALGDQARQTEAEPIFRESYELLCELKAAPDDILIAKLNLGTVMPDVGRTAEGERLLRECVQEARGLLPENQVDLPSTLGRLAVLLFDDGRAAEALPIINEAIALQSQHDEVGTLAAMWQTKSSILDMTGADAEAEDAALQCLELYQKILPPDHPDVLAATTRLLTTMTDRGEYQEATPRAERLVEALTSKLGPKHSHTGYALYLLGLCRLNAGNTEEAERLYERSVAAYPVDDPLCPIEVTDPQRGLAGIYTRRREFAKAGPIFQQAMERRIAQYGETDRRTIPAIADLGRMFMLAGDAPAAEVLVRRALDATAGFSPGDPVVIQLRRDLAFILIKQRMFADAEPVIRQSLPADPAAYTGPKLSARMALNHAGCLMELRETQAAEAELLMMHHWPRIFDKVDAKGDAEVIGMLVQIYDSQGRAEEAAQFRELLEQRASRDP